MSKDKKQKRGKKHYKQMWQAEVDYSIKLVDQVRQLEAALLTEQRATSMMGQLIKQLKAEVNQLKEDKQRLELRTPQYQERVNTLASEVGKLETEREQLIAENMALRGAKENDSCS